MNDMKEIKALIFGAHKLVDESIKRLILATDDPDNLIFIPIRENLISVETRLRVALGSLEEKVK